MRRPGSVPSRRARQQYRKPLDARLNTPTRSTNTARIGNRRVVALVGPKVLKLSGERSAGVRKLFRLVQLEQVAERIVQEGLVAGARDKWDPLHLDALLLQVADSGIDIVDSDRKVVCTEW